MGIGGETVWYWAEARSIDGRNQIGGLAGLYVVINFDETLEEWAVSSL